MIGLKIQDSEGNKFKIVQITIDNEVDTPDGVLLKGLDGQGEKEVSAFDLLYYTVITENN